MYCFVFFILCREAQRGPERPREAQRGPEKPREAQRGPERPREAQRAAERHRDAQRGPERPMYVLEKPVAWMSHLSGLCVTKLRGHALASDPHIVLRERGLGGGH